MCESQDDKFRLFAELFDDPTKTHKVIEMGTVLNKHRQVKIRRIVKSISKKTYKFRGYTVICHNTSSELTSDLGNALTSNGHCDLAVLWTYSHVDEKYGISLRSSGQVDCAKLAAEILGGGGHRNAAGGSHAMHPSFLFNESFNDMMKMLWRICPKISFY